MRLNYIKNVHRYNIHTKSYEKVNIIISGNKIEDIIVSTVNTQDCDKFCIDGKGLYIFPSLVDCHTHGALFCDFNTGSPDEIKATVKHYLSQGVTSLFPTTTSDSFDRILQAVTNITNAASSVNNIGIDGIHIEGPFLSEEKRGAHPKELLVLPDISLMDKILAISGDLKIRVTVAPELENALSFIKQCRERGINVSIGHTAADYNCVMRAIEAGADCVTHLFNAMSPLNHREPGLVGTALAEDIYTELICDGIHIHPEVVKLVYKCKDPEKVVLITDSMQAAGLPKNYKGEFLLGTLKVNVDKNQVRTADGTLAGSILGMFDAVLNYKKFSDCSLYDAFCAGSRNPRKMMNLQNNTGIIEKNQYADFIVCSENELFLTVYRGNVVYKNDNFYK